MASAGNAVPQDSSDSPDSFTLAASIAQTGESNFEIVPSIITAGARSAKSAAESPAPPPDAAKGSPRILLRRSWRSLLPRLLIGAVVLLAGVSASEAMGSASPMLLVIGGKEVAIELALFALIALLLLVRPVMLRFDGYSQVRRHHLVTTRGILSLCRQQINIPYEDIRGVKVDQLLWERPLGCGTIVCWSVSADHPEIRIPGVARVHSAAKVISRRVDEARIERRQNDPFRGERLRRIFTASAE